MINQRENRIEVIVRKEGSVSSAGANETDAEEVGAGLIDGEDPRGSVARANARRKRIIKTNATHAFAVTKQIGGLIAEYNISGLGAINGDQAYQQQVSRSFEKLEDATNITTSVMQGVTYGSWGGPKGAALGALFGLLSTGASTMVKYAKREREFNYKRFKENNAIEYQRARANINLTTGRLR